MYVYDLVACAVVLEDLDDDMSCDSRIELNIRESQVYLEIKCILRMSEYSQLVVKEYFKSCTLCITISRDTPEVVKEVGPIDNPQLVMTYFDDLRVTYAFQVFFLAIDNGEYNKDVFLQQLDQLLPRSGYIVCPRLMDYPSDSLHFKLKNVRMWGSPFQQIDATKCDLFHIPNNKKLHPLHELYNMCATCKQVHNRAERYCHFSITIDTEATIHDTE